MALLGWILAMLVFGVQPPERADDASRLAAMVGAIRAADYRGDRAELRRLSTTLDQIRDPRLRAYRSYWRGFAKWRRALNGFNETPTPADLRDDLEGAISAFRGALLELPDWIEAKIGIAGCAANLMYLGRADPERQQQLVAEYVPVMREVATQGAENPRALWLVGGSQLGAPPPYGGDAAKAAATYHRGLEAARREARERASQPAHVPSWGGAENLMSLAYLHSHSSLKDQTAALAYAQGALVAAPQWHYVADVLMPQIRELGKPNQ